MNAFNKTTNRLIGSMTVMSLMMSAAPLALAGEARTNASATGNLWGPGTATAGASYTGGQGYARTDTRSGNVNFASGVAIGIDNRGVCFSASDAVAGRVGPAFAGNLNICIGTDGSVASSGGLATANRGLTQTVIAGGFARTQVGGGIAGATAGARSDPRGHTSAQTWSQSIPARRSWWR